MLSAKPTSPISSPNKRQKTGDEEFFKENRNNDEEETVSPLKLDDDSGAMDLADSKNDESETEEDDEEQGEGKKDLIDFMIPGVHRKNGNESFSKENGENKKGSDSPPKNGAGAMELANGEDDDKEGAVVASSIRRTNVDVETEVVDWGKESKKMDEMFEEQARDKIAKLPKMDMPTQFCDHVKLFQHQKDGITWLVNMENGNNPSPFIYERTLKDGSVATYCKLSRRRFDKRPEPLAGAILADEMGLGKTLQTLGLILANPAGEDHQAKTTLIVCPKSVMSNWVHQIESHVKEGELSVMIYDGAKRADIIPTLKDDPPDVLLVGYETLTADKENVGKKKKKTRKPFVTIFEVSFWRLVLDESHKIRNADSKAFKAVMAVDAQRKICLTGTAFVNKPDDIQSLLAVINLKPLADKDVFRAVITYPIKERRRAGLTRLRTAMAYAALRRTKHATDIELTGKVVECRHVDFVEGNHKEIHDCIYLTAQAAFDASLRDEDDGTPWQLMFEMFLRVRQACCHGGLIPSGRHRRAAEVLEELEIRGDRPLTAAEGRAILEKLRSGGHRKPSNDDNDSGSESESEYSKASDDSASDDGSYILSSDDESSDDETYYWKELEPSPKINALLDATTEMEPDEKAVVFSQFTSFLDIIENEFAKKGHKTVRIDGSMSAEDRITAMNTFTNDDSVRFILCSLHAAGTGINLTRGNIVFVMDPWWNDAVEKQAMDRVHRVGQVRTVKCIRFVMKGTMEERLIKFQKAKAALGKGSLERITSAEERSAKITAMKDLFELNGDKDEPDYGEWK